MAVAKPSISIDPDLYDAIRKLAEEAGVSFSAWTEEAAKRRLQDEALDAAIADYEAEHGVISDEELDNSRLADSRFGPGGKGKRRSRRSA